MCKSVVESCLHVICVPSSFKVSCVAALYSLFSELVLHVDIASNFLMDFNYNFIG